MQIKAKIKQAFGNASESYDSVARLQRNTGKMLLENLPEMGRYGSVVDLGCGTGFLIEELLRLSSCSGVQFHAVDIALPMLIKARNKLTRSSQIHYIGADLEALPLAGQTIDLAMSNLAFQWCGDLSKAFFEIKRILKPGGRLLFSTFGPSTLKELKQAWRVVDDYSHINSFYSALQLTDMLQSSGFSNIELKTGVFIYHYESVWDLMFELKHLGARTIISGQNKHLTGKSKLQRMMGVYRKQECDGAVPATFEIITVSAIL